MPKTFLAALVISLIGGAGIGAPVAARDSATPVERLARVARLWGTVKFLHPYLAYRDIDWDAALVAAIPKIRQAASVEEYRQAVDEMLKALGDPLTSVMSAETAPDRKAPPWTALYKKETDGLIVVDLWQQLDAAPRGELFPAVQSLKKQLPLSPAVVVDLRTGEGGESFWSEYILRDLARALVPGSVQAPTERFVMHSGYRPQSGSTSGGYYSGFVTQSADTFEPEGELPAQGRKVVFLFDSNSRVPSVALALQARGMARFVTQGKLDESRLATTRDVDLGEGLRATRSRQRVAGRCRRDWPSRGCRSTVRRQRRRARCRDRRGQEGMALAEGRCSRCDPVRAGGSGVPRRQALSGDDDALARIPAAGGRSGLERHPLVLSLQAPDR